MNRAKFEALRDLPGKTINGDIRFARSRATAPLLVAENVAIVNGHGLDVRLSINYNPEVGSKTFNVVEFRLTVSNNALRMRHEPCMLRTSLWDNTTSWSFAWQSRTMH